jgi:hypothetical protein
MMSWINVLPIILIYLNVFLQYIIHIYILFMLNSCSSCEKIKNTTLLTIPSTNRRMANSIPLTHIQCIHDHNNQSDHLDFILQYDKMYYCQDVTVLNLYFSLIWELVQIICRKMATPRFACHSDTDIEAILNHLWYFCYNC